MLTSSSKGKDEIGRKVNMKRITRIILILGMVVLLIFSCVRLKVRYSDEKEKTSDSGQTISEVSVSNTVDTNEEESIKNVLLGDIQFFYVSGGNIEITAISDVPLLFDADDSFMKILAFSVVDLDRDGGDEVILFVEGVAGDTGGKIVLHQIGDDIYGYISDNRNLVNLKTDGTFSYSDPTGVVEGGIGAITGFSESGYTFDKVSYGTGTYEGWNVFVVDHQSATEEEYFNAVAIQNEKPDAEWYDFTAENINAVF